MLPYGVGKPLSDEQVLQAGELCALKARFRAGGAQTVDPERDRTLLAEGGQW